MSAFLDFLQLWLSVTGILYLLMALAFVWCIAAERREERDKRVRFYQGELL